MFIGKIGMITTNKVATIGIKYMHPKGISGFSGPGWMAKGN